MAINAKKKQQTELFVGVVQGVRGYMPSRRIELETQAVSEQRAVRNLLRQLEKRLKLAVGQLDFRDLIELRWQKHPEGVNYVPSRYREQ